MISQAKKSRGKLRFALVGAGAVAHSYVAALEHCAEARLVAVADCRLEAARRIAERMRCASYGRVERMVDDCDLDAAIVCTPPASHPDICIHLMQRKIHTLCEKPFAIDSISAERMVRASVDADVILTMASKFRYVDDIISAKSMIASGLLGDLILFQNTFTHRVDMYSRWNARPDISGGGVLIDNGTHSVDLMHYFLGPLSELHVREGKRSQALKVEDTVCLSARSVCGVLCNVDLSWSVSPLQDSFLSVYGTAGAVSIGWKKSLRLDSAHHIWIPFGSGYNKVDAFRSQIQNFARAIRGEERLLIAANDALESVRIIELAYHSLRQNEPVHVHDAPLASADIQRKPQLDPRSASSRKNLN